MMIDWITGKFPFYAPGLISDGEFLSINAAGEIETRTVKRLVVGGSYSSNITIRTVMVDDCRNTCLVELSGNPVKFLQGHNLWGSCDIVNLIYCTLERISSILGYAQPLAFYSAWRKAAGTVSRIDINEMYSLGSRSNVLQWLYHASATSRTRLHSAIMKGSTVYWNADSKRWVCKAYAKGQELELPRNNKRGLIELTDSVKQWADDILRIEITLKSKQLHDLMCNRLDVLCNIEPSDLFNEFKGLITMSDQLELKTCLRDTLKGAILHAYTMWDLGIDCRSRMSKSAFYRHRKELLNYGIDISIPKPQQTNNVVPFIKTIVLQPAVVPDWAHGTELFYEPKKLYV